MNEPTSAVSPPGVSGVSLLKIPVSDLVASAEWYSRVFGATRLAQFDHFDAQGQLYAVMLAVPGLTFPMQLRLAPHTAQAIAGFDPVGFAVPTLDDLERWESFLSDLGIENSNVLRGLVGWFLIVRDPDGLSIRLFSDEHHDVDPDNAVTDSPWLEYPAENR